MEAWVVLIRRFHKGIVPFAAAFAIVVALSTSISAQDAPKPLSAPMPAAIPTPRDVPYPGTLRILVDATDLVHRVLRIHEVIPARPGQLIMQAPRWLPGDHEPDGEVIRMAGFSFAAGGRSLPWTRDPVSTNAFHLTVPQGASEITLDFQYLAPVTQDIGRVVITPDMMNLQWTFASIYPAGYYVSQIPVIASVKLPAGWKQGSGLEVDSISADNTVLFKGVPYETLIDSPLMAGRYYKHFDLDPGARVPVSMDVVADKASSLDVPDDVLAIHRKLVQQAYKLYGSHHYDHYDFLVAATDLLGGIGLEHHRSSEDSVGTDYFTNWKESFVGRDLLAHEFTHSWNGKFRRPGDLWTPDYQTPMRDSLLWVYEGQTEYWGNVLAARSGLFTQDQYFGHIASIAAYYDTLAARQWRDLEDTTNDPIIAQRAGQSWPNYQASEEYYDQGLLIWLDADTLIREKTGGKKSLDDFARGFFGVNDGAWGSVTYSFEDVAKALNDVYAYDWTTFLNTRLHDHGQKAPFDGIARAGYKLTYTDAPTEYTKGRETLRKITDFAYSLGITVAADGTVRYVLWDSAAFKAGMNIGTKIVAVNGREFDADDLKQAITEAAKSGNTAALELLLKNGNRYETVKIDYHGGLRYPHLERVQGTVDLWKDILAERN